MDGEWAWETEAGWDEALGLGDALLRWRYSRLRADGRSEQLMAVWEGNDVQVQMQQRQQQRRRLDGNDNVVAAARLSRSGCVRLICQATATRHIRH